MGSAKVYSSNLQTMAEEKKKFTKLFKGIKRFFRKDKKKDKREQTVEEDKVNVEEITVSVQDVLQNFTKLALDKKNNEKAKALEFEKTIIVASEDSIADESDKGSLVDEADKVSLENEADKFSSTVVEVERVPKLPHSERIDSQSSEDSGFGEEKKDLADDLSQLKIEDDGKKKKRWQTVYLKRSPFRKKLSSHQTPRPYPTQDGSCRQIHQVNKQFFSGGQIIENSVPVTNTNNLIAHNLDEVETALRQVQKTTTISQHENGEDWLLEAVDEIITKHTQAESESNLAEFGQPLDISEFNYNLNVPAAEPTPNPIEEFTNMNHLNTDNDLVDQNNYDDVLTSLASNATFVYPTPPCSVDIASPMSDCQNSMYRHSECTLSPDSSSAINSDNEVFQEIAPIADLEYPVSVSNNDVEKTLKRDRAPSGSVKKHMKQYKDMQKEIGNGFSKKYCCQINKKTCKQVFQEHMQKLRQDERMSMCYNVTAMDLNQAYGVLQNILISLSQGSEFEDYQHAMFCLICEKVMGQNSALFVGQFGLKLLSSAALRCPRRPIFTRYLVECIQTSIRHDPSLLGDRRSIFHELDAQGDTLVIACARVGDTHADVLYEIVKDKERPLFRLEHLNADGMSALHVSCTEHSPSAPKLHSVHVLLEHAGADIWKGNMKSGDTPLHLAVNSMSCDLQLVMVLFRHVDRKLWKKLAHTPNMRSKTPLEYAREATRSPLRQHHPFEVFEFLKKCRN
nr:unnamed protein product [Amyelois transitella]XP_013189883.1 unnamed protein product [Amyelois transitella]XP_013189884.1 unnamed protein product [Amyelois transitella]XP_013189886.1 unnamed protein product [Amyelois transitella]